MATQPKQPHYDEEVPEDLMTKKIEEIQRDIDRLNEKASSEILEVEQRYNKLRKPLFDQRSKLIAQIPNFWSTVFKHHVALNSCLTEADHEVIKYLRNVEVQEFEDIKSGYRVTFTFEPNPYFSNSSLEKEFHVGENGQPTIKCSTINWYPDKDITQATNEAGKKRNANSESFFNWFIEEDEYGGDEIGDIIKDELWVSPIPYFNLEDYEDEEEEGDEELIDEEDDEEEEEFENEDEEDAVDEEDEDSKDQ